MSRLPSHPLQFALAVLIALAVYCAVLLAPLPASWGAAARHGFGLWLLAGWGLLYLAHRYGRLWLQGFPIAVLSALFALALSGLWSNAYSEMQVLSGLLPLSDGAAYYADVQRLLHGFLFSPFSGRHVLGASFFAGVLYLVSENLMLALAVITALAALSAALACRELDHSFGPAPAALLGLLLFLFFRPFIGLVNSESLGFIAGCLGFAFCLRAARLRDLRMALSGVFVLSIGLLARPGPFLILPGLLLFGLFIPWPGFPSVKRFRPVAALAALLAIPLAFGLSTLVQRSITAGESRAFSNYAYTLYGIAKGGAGWEQFLQDYPQLLSASPVDAEQAAYQKAFELLISDPGQAIKAILNGYRQFFSITDSSAFGFLCSGELTAYNRSTNGPLPSESAVGIHFARAAGWLLSGFGIWKLWKRRKTLFAPLFAFAGVGLLASVPFLPPHDAGVMRVYAAGLPFLVAFPAIGLAVASRSSAPVEDRPARILLLSLSGLVLVIAVALPLLIRLSARPLPVVHPDCPSGTVPAVITPQSGSVVKVRADASLRQTRLPAVRISDFHANLDAFFHPELLQPLKQAPAATDWFVALDLLTGRAYWVIAPGGLLAPGRQSTVCADRQVEMQKNGLDFVRVRWRLE